jgi:hypothetical protein
MYDVIAEASDWLVAVTADKLISLLIILATNHRLRFILNS